MLWPQGDLALARAAAAAGIPFTLSTVSNYSLGEAEAARCSGRIWFQLYPVKDQKAIDRLVDRAQEAGCDTLVVTTDVPVLGAREWDQRNYRAPMQAEPVEHARRPRAPALAVAGDAAARRAAVREPDRVPAAGQRSRRWSACASWARRSTPRLCWEDMERMRARWPGKLVLKGILCVEDARARSTSVPTASC